MAKLPPLRDAITEFMDENVKLNGTIQALLSEVDITRGKYYGWQDRNRYEKEPLLRLLKKLKRLGMDIPTTDPDRLKDHYDFEMSDPSKAREQKAATLEALWGANGSYRVQGQFQAKSARDTLRSLHHHCYLLLFTSTVYPMIYRPGPHLEGILSALADALANCARIMVFVPSCTQLEQIKARVGPTGIHENYEFGAGMEECRIALRRLLREKKILDDAAINCRLYTHLGQISCDSSFMTCGTGRVTMLFGDNSNRIKPKSWGAERFADDSVIRYSGKNRLTSIWTERIKREAIHFLDHEINKLNEADQLGTITTDQRHSLCGANNLLWMLRLVDDVLSDD